MSENQHFIVCENLVKIFKIKNIEVLALQGLDFFVQHGEMLGIVGASGSGKTTLMNVLGGLTRPSAGKAQVGGRNLLTMSQRQLNAYRKDEVGFVWQQALRNLIPYLTVDENIRLPMMMNGTFGSPATKRIDELLDLVQLSHRRTHRPVELSGGEQQRVAIAVALANQPTLLLADEPTGELDSATSDLVYETFRNLNRELKLTTIIVSHDPLIAEHVGRVIAIRDGKTAAETVRSKRKKTGSDEQEQFEELILLDSAGRLQIPKEYRQQLAIKGRVRMEVSGEGIMIRPAMEYDDHTPVNATSSVMVQEATPDEGGLIGGLRKRFSRKKDR